MGGKVIFLQIPVVVGNIGDAAGNACALRAWRACIRPKLEYGGERSQATNVIR